jgi:hypothetical protein
MADDRKQSDCHAQIVTVAFLFRGYNENTPLVEQNQGCQANAKSKNKPVISIRVEKSMLPHPAREKSIHRSSHVQT